MRFGILGVGAMRRALLPACGVLLVLAAPATGASQTPETRGAASLSSASPALRVDIDRLADSARTLGVPTEPLYLKAAEGVLKHASDERVTAVVSRLLRELVEARGALGPTATSGELVAGANVIHAGLEPAALQRVRSARSAQSEDGSLLMPLVVLADLVARHVTPEVATSSVAALVERGAPDQELARLRSRVETEIGRGQSPDLATRTRTAAVLEELPRSSTPRRPLRPPASSTGP